MVRTYPSYVKFEFLKIYKVVILPRGLFFVWFTRGVGYTVQGEKFRENEDGYFYTAILHHA